MRLLVTRAAQDGQRAAARLAARGHEALLSPVLQFETLTAPAPVSAPDGLIATSSRAFAGAPTQLRHAPLHVVGERTARAGKAHGFSNIANVAPDAARLAEILCALAPQRFVYLAGVDRKDGLEKSLPRAGHRVETLLVYHAVAVADLAPAARDALGAGALDGALHYSRRSAEIFIALCARARLSAAAARLTHFALSPDCAAPLIAAGWRVVIADAPNEEALFSLLA